VALTPQQLAELQRLKEMYAPLVEAQRRKDQAQANAEKMGITPPTPGKAKGGVVSMLRKHGQPVPTELEAMRRMSQGHRVFVAHEQDEHPREVTSVRELAGYAPDQIYTLAPQHKATGGPIPSHVTHAHHLEIEERPL
jgi:hypothetical protein